MKIAAEGSQIYFYWDIFLILNFIMNLFLIGMTGIIRRKYIDKKRLFLAAVVGSIQMTAGFAFSLAMLPDESSSDGWLSALLFFLAVVTMLLMLQIVYCEKQIVELIRDGIGMVKVSILTGGCIWFLKEKVTFRNRIWGGCSRNTGLWLVLLGTCGVFAVLWACSKESARREQQRHVMDGTLTAMDGTEYPLRVLFDTGNQLVSPYTGEAVMVIDKKLVETMGIAQKQNPLWIPYHSIGGDGLLPAYRFAKLQLQNGQMKENFLAAASENISGDHTIQIILNG